MNQYSKRSKIREKIELKTHGDRSHNLDLTLIHLVKFLARQAAEEDYKLCDDKLSNYKLEGEE